MNKRIKELALESTLEYNIFLPDAWSGEDADIENFATLIIEECIGIIMKNLYASAAIAQIQKELL